MAEMNPSHWIDEKSGFCPATKTFHSLRPPTPFPPDHRPLSLADYAFSLLRSAPHSPLETTTVLIDASSHHRLSYSQFIHQVRSLAASLRRSVPGLTKGDTAFILCPPSLKIPVLYFALLSIGVTLSPANPLSSDSEISHQIHLCRPAIAFASSRTARKLPTTLRLGTVLVDSEEFDSLVSLEINAPAGSGCDCEPVEVSQSDTAAILYSSGTTGLVKGVRLTHRNLISLIATLCYGEAASEEEPRPVSLFTLPLFHVFGFFMLVRAVAMAETLVLMERFDFERMLKAVEKYRITYMPVSPPLVVALTKSELVEKYDLSSLQLLGSGGAPLSKEVSETFASRFPNVLMVQGYGLTESGGGVVGMADPDEAKRHGSAGRLMANMEAKIVHPQTGELLLPGQKGELWLRGPTIMKGYVGNDEATAATLDAEGWLKTGDLCYFSSDGFLFIVDRLKELIKYKAYQVPPAELEFLLLSSPEIADAAVIPYPDEEAGEIPMAFVVRKPGSSITEAQVMELIAKQVAPYKKVRRVAFINSIPKSLAGKILRRELLNHALSKPRL